MSTYFRTSLISKIVTMHNVVEYRALIEKLRLNNDVEEIENLRRKYYEKFLDSCFSCYNCMKNEINSEYNKYLNSFGGLEFMFDSDDDSKEFNFIITYMIIDYLFEDIAYNVFIDIRELLNFSLKTNILSNDDYLLYESIIRLDDMNMYEKNKAIY